MAGDQARWHVVEHVLVAQVPRTLAQLVPALAGDGEVAYQAAKTGPVRGGDAIETPRRAMEHGGAVRHVPQDIVHWPRVGPLARAGHRESLDQPGVLRAEGGWLTEPVQQRLELRAVVHAELTGTYSHYSSSTRFDERAFTALYA